MKLSKRNKERLAKEQERLARGKPLISKFEHKQLTAAEINAREREFFAKKASGGIVSK